MRSFKKFILESIEQEELDEAVEVRHDRYMRSHGKKASGGIGSWMFTHKAMGDVDHKNEKEVYSAPSGKFSDAKKAAQQWAKKHGHSTVYVMEEVELDEKLKASDDMGDWVKDFQKSDAPQFKGKSQKKRQQMAIAAKLAAERNEEVELDEVSDKMLDRYRQKAFADQPSGDDGSNKYRKRKFGRDLAFAKQTGRAKVLATKEEVELEEGPIKAISTAFKKHKLHKAIRKTAADREQMIRQSKTGYYPDYADEYDASLAKRDELKKQLKSLSKKEEVELEEKAYVSSLSPEMGRKGSHDVIGKDGKVVKSYPYTKDGMKAAQAHLSKMKEEVELDEVSASTLRSYVDKSRADKSRQQKARTVAKNDYKKYGIPSDKERADAAHRKASQRNTGISMAKRKLGGYTKGTEPKVLAREEVELDEAKRDIYHQHMLKALGKSRLPKDHSYTSAIATNGDFVVKDGGGRTVGRIAKGDHNLKEAAPKMKGDWLKKEREKNRAHDAAMGRTATGRKKPVRQMTSTQRSLAKMRGESEE